MICIKLQLAKKGDFKYTVLNTIGQGAQGTVYEIKNGKNRYALKVYNQNDKHSITAQRRARKIGSLINNPRTGALSRAWSIDNGEDNSGNPVMMYKLFPYRAIEDYHEKFEPPQALRVRERMIVGLTAGLVEIYQKGIVHADLAPINVLYAPDGKIAIIDFDGAGYYPKKTGDKLKPIVRGHIQFPGWVAPHETLTGSATFSTDVWWVGSIMMKVLTNFSPFFFLKVADTESLRELNEMMDDVTEWPPNFENIARHSKIQPNLTPNILKKIRKLLNQTIATATLGEIFVNYQEPELRPSAVKLWTSFRSRVFK